MARSAMFFPSGPEGRGAQPAERPGAPRAPSCARVARNPLSLGLAGVKVLGSTEEFQGEKVPCGAIMALRGQKFPSDEAAPASDEVESSAILASDPPAAGATPAIVDAGAPENRARPVGAKAPNQIVPKGREGGIDAFAVPVEQQRAEAAKEQDTTQADKERNNDAHDPGPALKEVALEGRENDLETKSLGISSFATNDVLAVKHINDGGAAPVDAMKTVSRPPDAHTPDATQDVSRPCTSMAQGIERGPASEQHIVQIAQGPKDQSAPPDPIN
ncbi:hypothetical protein T484DRAFT_1809193 [Baffinella frigidus]|nr:hypothetical protein T484DRAFT_1809193 [Cryptophyta sp. CCMP2293]